MTTYRKSAKPRRGKNKTNSQTKVSQAVKTYVKKVVSIAKPEVKHLTDYYTEQIIDAIVLPYQQFEFLPVQGTGVNARTGNEVKLIGLSIHGIMKNNSVNTQLIRTLVLSCPGDTDIAPLTMELFKDASATGLPTPMFFSGVNDANCLFMINDMKFKVHHDHVWKLAATSSSDAKDVVQWKKFIKFNSTIKFDANTAGQGNQNRRFFVMYITSDPQQDAGGGAMEISGVNKWYFTDA